MSDIACPSCAAVGPPPPEDCPTPVFLCVYCRALGIITPERTLRKPTEQELDELLKNPLVLQGIRDLAEQHRQHGAPKVM